MLSAQASAFVPYANTQQPSLQSKRTSNGQSALRMSKTSWSNRSMPKIYNPPPRGYMRVVDLDSTDQIAMVIGKNGTVFNAITHQTPDLTYIWYDRLYKRIEIWGDTHVSVSQGYQKVMDRVHMIRSQKERAV